MMDHQARMLACDLTPYRPVVLLVDDQLIVANAVQKMLAGEDDIELHYCRDSKKAVEMAERVSPTVILQDLIMPDIDGLSLIRAYRAHPQLKDVPLIVLSSKEEVLIKADAFELGANDYLVKLPDRVELIVRIRYHSRAYINFLQRNEAHEALLRSQQILASELSRAAQYVKSLLPALLAGDAVRTAWRFVPSVELGGDSFGYHWIDDDHFAFHLLDVCDHGVGPALLSVSVMHVLNAQALPEVDFRRPGEVLRALNESFQMDDHDNLFFTIWYGVFNRRTRELTYASGGHPPALLLNGADGTVALRTPNALIGAMRDVAFASGSVRVQPGARLYVFSDAAYEVGGADGGDWGFEDLRVFLARPPQEGGAEIDELYAHHLALQGGDALDDDFSVLRVSFP